jgi:hypothetical protein
MRDTITNSQIAEFLAVDSATAEGNKRGRKYNFRTGLRVGLGAGLREGRGSRQGGRDRLPLGLAAALKAGLPKERILNCMPYEELGAWTALVKRETRPRKPFL